MRTFGCEPAASLSVAAQINRSLIQSEVLRGICNSRHHFPRMGTENPPSVMVKRLSHKSSVMMDDAKWKSWNTTVIQAVSGVSRTSEDADVQESDPPVNALNYAAWISTISLSASTCSGPTRSPANLLVGPQIREYRYRSARSV